MENQFFDNFFYYASKITIILPLILIIFGLLLKFNQKQKENYIDKIKINPTEIVFSPTTRHKKINLDLRGPWICSFNDKNASITAYIKERKIKVEVKTSEENNYFLVNNDCLYQWRQGQFSGDKSCGIGYYLTFAESILNNNQNLFFNLFLKQFKEVNKNFSFADWCRKENINDDIFLLPTTILFKNKEKNLTVPFN